MPAFCSGETGFAGVIMLSAAVELTMADEERTQDNSSWFDRLEPKEKLSPEDKSKLADKYLTRFYASLVLPFSFFYVGLRPALGGLPSELSWFFVSEENMNPFAFISILVGLISVTRFKSKAYTISLMRGFYVLSDVRLRHLKPLVIIPILVLITEVFVRVYS